MRDSKKPNLAIDWESFDGVDRTVAARDVASGEEVRKKLWLDAKA